MWFDIIIIVVVVCLILIHLISFFVIRKEVKKLEKRAVRTDNDINTLQYNQNVLVSTLREIGRKQKQNEKTTKIFKRKLRSPFQEEKSEE